MPARWSPSRPNVLVVACSDGRLQKAIDGFLTSELQIADYDRLYVPGGAGALASSGQDIVRAQRMRKECRYLIDLHGVTRVIALQHGPSTTGPPEAMCADYLRKLPWASIELLRDRQLQDVRELLHRREEWAGPASVSFYRCEVGPDHQPAFVALDGGTSGEGHG
jgi:hypothetical protein